MYTDGHLKLLVHVTARLISAPRAGWEAEGRGHGRRVEVVCYKMSVFENNRGLRWKSVRDLWM